MAAGAPKHTHHPAPWDRAPDSHCLTSDRAEAGQSGTPTSWGSEKEPIAVPAYHGMPASVADDVVMIRLNDPEQARRQLEKHAGRLACVLIDPMPSRAGLIALAPEFISTLVETTQRLGILLICDEVLNLRQGYHGASARYGLKPDIITMGKIIGGGFPIGAIGGRADIMQVFGSVHSKAKIFQGGTFSANPVSMVAGLASMRALTQDQIDRLEKMGGRLRSSIAQSIQYYQAPFCVTGAASLIRIHTKKSPPREFREAFSGPAEMAVLRDLQQHFFNNGITIPVGAAACLSTAMSNADIDKITVAWISFLDTNQQTTWSF